MKAYRLEKRIARKGTLHLEALPFEEGERVEVIVLSCEEPEKTPDRSPLRGTVKKYEAPTDPVAAGEWEAAQ